MVSYQHKLLAAAVIASLSLSACGKKKDLYGEPVPAPTPQTGAPQPGGPGGQGGPVGPAGQPTGAPGGGLQTDPKNPSTITGGVGGMGGMGGKTQPGLGSGPSKAGDLPAPPKLEPADDGDGVNGGGGNVNNGQSNGHSQNDGLSDGGTGSTIKPNSAPNVVDTRPLPSAPQENNTLPGYNPRDPKSIDGEGLTKRITGGATSEGLLYTSSSTDNIMDFLRARNEKMSFNTRALNKAAAASVSSASLSIDGDSGEALVTLKVVERDEVKTYNLTGSASGGSASQLKVVRAGNKEVTTGSRPLVGTIKCLDFDGGCENTFVRLQIGAKGESAIINIVFRQSAADLYFSLSPASGNREYDIMRDFAYNTIQGNPSPNRADLNRVTLTSWEVVNGRSGFVASILGLNRELLAFSGPLLAPEAGTSVNISLSRVTAPRETSLDLLSSSSVGLNYQNMISDARLVANNGLGQIRILFKMRGRVGYSNDRFAITYLRKIKPIVSLSDENLK